MHVFPIYSPWYSVWIQQTFKTPCQVMDCGEDIKKLIIYLLPDGSKLLVVKRSVYYTVQNEIDAIWEAQSSVFPFISFDEV